MPQTSTPRRTPLLVLGFALALSGGASAFTLIDFELPSFSGFSLNAGVTLRHTFAGLKKTGYAIRSADGSALTISGNSRYDPSDAWQPGTQVQEGFVLLDGTLSLDVVAEKEGGVRAGTRTTYRMDLGRDSLRPDAIRGRLVRQGVVRDEGLARMRARFINVRDARVMRRVERNGESRWVRAVRVLGTPDRMRFRERKPPSGVLGHFGFERADNGDTYVWAVMDRNSRYAIGVTVDRDNDGRPNPVDNCLGTPNPNQSDADGDQSGDACDADDDNDEVLDGADNCPLTANPGQENFDGDGSGNACDLDDDNDLVADGADRCLATAIGSRVDGNGCSIEDQCPCDSDWRNHGAYVKCVARTSELFVQSGLITAVQKDAIVSAGGRSSCGS